MSLSSIRAVLFDKDGTLFDFDATWAGVIDGILDRLAPDASAREAMARAAGLDPVSRRFVPGSPFVAGAVSEIATLWARWRPDLGEAGIEREANRLAETMTGPQTLVPAVPDLPGFLAGLRAAGLRLGVATHDSEGAARAHLGAAGALGAFDFIAGYDSGHGLKPGPGLLHAFAAHVSIEPSGIVMVGDSLHDLMMVRSAGAALAVGVLTGPATAADLADHADHILPSIADLPALLGMPPR